MRDSCSNAFIERLLTQFKSAGVEPRDVHRRRISLFIRALSALAAVAALLAGATAGAFTLQEPDASAVAPPSWVKASQIGRLSVFTLSTQFDHAILPRLNLNNQVTFNVSGGLAYTVFETSYRNLRAPQGTSANVYGINDRGDMVGQATLPRSDGQLVQRAVMWSLQGVMTELGGLGGDKAVATDINLNGQVIGAANTTAGGPMHAFLWTSRTGMVDLGMLAGQSTYPFRINQAGQVLGITLAGANSQGFVWTAQRGLLALGNFAGSPAMPMAMNELGQVVGYASARSFPVDARAFIRSPDGNMQDLGGLGGSWAYALDINDQGQVVGVSGPGTNPAAHAFLWSAQGGMRELGPLAGSDASCSAVKINKAAQVVGQCGDKAPRAFFWSAVDGMREMNSLVLPGSPALATALTISDTGSILALDKAGNLILLENIQFAAPPAPLMLRSPFGMRP